MLKFALKLLICSLVFCGCKPNNKMINAQNHPPEMNAENQYTESYNMDSTLLLRKKTVDATPDSPFPSVTFVVVDTGQNRTVYEGSEIQSRVEWHDRVHLKITKIPETVTMDQKTEDAIFLINVFTGKMIRLSDFQNPNDYQNK